MTNPAFLVDGQMEQLIIQRMCPNKKVNLIGCNGDNVAMSAIAKALDARIRLLEDYDPIIIILDRERREKSCETLIDELSVLLDEKGHKGRYIIGMSDRCTENWILSDWAHIVEQDDSYLPFEEDAQGMFGKSVIRKLLPSGLIYHETTVGVELFQKCRSAQIFASNVSFKMLIDQLTNIECWWLKDIDQRFDPVSWATVPSDDL